MLDNVTISIIAPIHPEDFFDLLWQGVWEATFDLSSFGVEVQNLTTEGYDVAEQRKILEGLRDSRPDAIALMPVHVTGLNDLIDWHVQHGTPVVTFHGDAPASKRVGFVRPDLQQAGALAGELLAKLMHGRGRILAFPGSLDEFHLAQRYEGFGSALAPYAGEIKVIPQLLCSSDERGDITAALRASYESSCGCYIGNDDIVQILGLMEELGIKMPCVGFSNTDLVRPFLERGILSAVIDEKRYQLGYFAVQKAYEAILKSRNHLPIANVQMPAKVVLGANALSAGDSLDSAFELLVRQRTEVLISYKNRLEEANAKLLDMAVTDPLTGLYNRRKFEEVLDHEVNRAQRYGPVSLLAIDLNYFKAVNDRYGHQIGDKALKAVAKALQSCCRVTDTCARLGGDEFAVILAHSDEAAANVVTQRIHELMSRTKIPAAERDLSLSLSIGMATLPGDAGDASSLIAAADASMYEAKQASRLEHARVL